MEFADTSGASSPLNDAGWGLALSLPNQDTVCEVSAENRVVECGDGSLSVTPDGSALVATTEGSAAMTVTVLCGTDVVYEGTSRDLQLRGEDDPCRDHPHWAGTVVLTSTAACDSSGSGA
jgi:hypothetical protein